jgi:hypothetical protein
MKIEHKKLFYDGEDADSVAAQSLGLEGYEVYSEDENGEPDEAVASFVNGDDARRAVATWNACAGIPTEALEAGIVGELVEWADEAWQRIRIVDKNTEKFCVDGKCIVDKAKGETA